MGELHDILFSPHYGFLRTAFVLSAFASVSFGIVGTFIVVRRIGYIAGAISHCAFGGIGIGLFLRTLCEKGFWGMAFLVPLAPWIDPTFVAIIVSVLCALIIGAVQLYGNEREDTIIGTIWSIGMALGLLFLYKTPGNYSISSYIYGEILLVSRVDVYFVIALAGLNVLVFSLLFFRFQSVCFDEEFAKLRGMRTGLYFQILLVLVALTVVLMIGVVGIILVIAMLTLPAATAGRLTSRLFPMTLLAVLVCFVCSWLGLYLSFKYNLPAGPVMILIAAAAYSAVFGFQTLSHLVLVQWHEKT